MLRTNGTTLADLTSDTSTNPTIHKSRINKSEIYSLAVTICCNSRFDQRTAYTVHLKFTQHTYYIWYYGTTDIRHQTANTVHRTVTSSQPKRSK